MARNNWRRYYMVVYDKPYPCAFVKMFRDRDKAHAYAQERLAYWRTYDAARRPLGVVGVRAKRDPIMQQTLFKQVIPGD